MAKLPRPRFTTRIPGFKEVKDRKPAAQPKRFELVELMCDALDRPKWQAPALWDTATDAAKPCYSITVSTPLLPLLLTQGLHFHIEKTGDLRAQAAATARRIGVMLADLDRVRDALTEYASREG